MNNGWAEPCLLPTLTRSLDRLDSVDMLLPSKCPSWEEDYNPVSDSLNDSSCISQVSVVTSQKVSGLGRAPALTQKHRHPGPAPVERSPDVCTTLLFGLSSHSCLCTCVCPTDCPVAREQSQGLTCHGLS